MNQAEILKKQQIGRVLPYKIRALMDEQKISYESLYEIRLRIGQPLICVTNGKEQVMKERNEPYIVTGKEISEALECAGQYSLYAFEQELKQGFITIEGGHRIGVSGKAVLDGNQIRTLKYISSMNIRVAHEIIGCGKRILPLLGANKRMLHTLIIAPPRCGKTTVLRDIIRLVSDGNEIIKGCTVGVVDERSELGGCYLGVAQNDLGIRTDILDCCPKAEGMIMMIRSMAPEVIAVDEIGAEEDVHAIEYAMHCGCRMLASVHGESVEEVRRRPYLGDLIANERFDRYVVLDYRDHAGHLKGVYDAKGNVLLEDS